MAEGFNITDVRFAGDSATDYMITRATIGLDTIDNNCIMVKTDVKKAFNIPRMVITNIFQKRNATPTSQGSITIDGNVITPLYYNAYTEYNPNDLREYWLAYQLPTRIIDATLPQTFEGYLIDIYLKQVNQNNEFMLWRGRLAFDPANGGLDPATKNQDAGDSVYMYYDGLIKLLLADAGTIKPSFTTLTESTILAAMDLIYSYVPQALINHPNLRFLMNRTTWRLYQGALTNNTFKDNQTTEGTKMAYKGMEIVPLGGMPDQTIVCCISTGDNTSALWLGCNSADDSNAVLIDKTVNASELWFIKIMMNAAVQFGFSQEIVLYTNITN